MNLIPRTKAFLLGSNIEMVGKFLLEEKSFDKVLSGSTLINMVVNNVQNYHHHVPCRIGLLAQDLDYYFWVEYCL